MKNLVLIFFLSLTNIVTYSQWNVVVPIPDPIPGINFHSIDFVDSLNGWASTNKGTIIHTTDGGKSWFYQVTGTLAPLRKIRFADILNGWAVGDSGKIIHTTDGGNTWYTQNTLANMRLTMLSVINSQNVWAAGTWGSTGQDIILHTTTSGDSWNTISPLLSEGEHLSDMIFINENKGWYCTWQYVFPFSGGGIYYTSNGGQSWFRQQASGNIQSAIFFLDVSYGWSVGDWSIIRTSNGGVAWSPPGTISSKYFSDVFFIDQNIGWVVELTYYGGYFDHNVIHFSTNGGQSFLSQATTETGYRIYDFDVVERRMGWAAVVTSVGTGGYLLHTTNGGGVFPSPPNLIFPIDGSAVNIDTVNFNWSGASPNVSGYKLTLSTDSLYVSQTDTFVTSTSAKLLNLLPDQKYFWKVKALNSLGYGAYSNTSSFNTNLTAVDKEQLSVSFQLSQNFPNPFNPSTKISWQTPVSGRQTLKVYDVLGNEIATLVDEYRNAGSYEINFNANKLSSGVYFYQLKSGNFVQTKKMILMK